MRQTAATAVLFAISLQNRSENDKNEPQKKNTQNPEGTQGDKHHPNTIEKSEPLIASDVRGTKPLEHQGGWARSGPQRLGPKWPKTLPKLSETEHLDFK